MSESIRAFIKRPPVFKLYGGCAVGSFDDFKFIGKQIFDYVAVCNFVIAEIGFSRRDSTVFNRVGNDAFADIYSYGNCLVADNFARLDEDIISCVAQSYRIKRIRAVAIFRYVA